MERRKGKGKTRKNNNTTWGNKPESTGERRNIKKMPTKSKRIQTKRDILKQAKENSPYTWEEMTWKHTNNRIQEKPNNFGLRYGNQKP